jgi:hypothetical protein
MSIKEEVSQQVRGKIVVRLFVNDLPQFLEVNGFGQGGPFLGALPQQRGQGLAAGRRGPGRAGHREYAGERQLHFAPVLIGQMKLFFGNLVHKAALELAAVNKFNKAAGGDHLENTLLNSKVMVSYSG